LTSFPDGAWAHGGVSVDADKCILTAGLYRAHFTGYQPKARGSQEFCEDIPAVERAIMVVDFIDNALREMDVDFRIIRDVNDIGNNAVYEDLGGEAAIEKATLKYIPPQAYPTGTITMSYDFVEPGRYIGLVTMQRPDGGQVFRSVFPFSVGVGDSMPYIKTVIAIVLFAVGLYYFSERHRRNLAKNRT
jgi:hypothetical protein